MFKRLLSWIIIIGFFVGIYVGVNINSQDNTPEAKLKEVEQKIFGKFQNRAAEVTEFYTYGKSLNISGKISNIEKDNFESARIVVSDGKDYQKMYKMNAEFKNDEIYFYSNQEMNNTIIIDDLRTETYYIFLRIKLNNSNEPKYYSFTNVSECKDITYYTITKEKSNREAKISFKQKNYNDKKYSYMSISFEDIDLPEEIYDVVIDAGHGGTDFGVKLEKNTESDITLEYANLLKQSLEDIGLKVKLTRNNENTDLYTDTNMYDATGRITSACKSKAKLMISLHINNGEKDLKGFEIYSPSKSNLELAKNISEKIKQYSTISYSNNLSYKKYDGVYVKNFTENIIKEYENTAIKKGYEPYNITVDTPYLYTIREVGGIATNAYVDGRNQAYSKNIYYNVNYGIECYQIELGYIKNDLEIIKNEKESYIRAITEAVKEWK